MECTRKVMAVYCINRRTELDVGEVPYEFADKETVSIKM